MCIHKTRNLLVLILGTILIIKLLQCEPAIRLHMNIMISSMDGIMHLYVHVHGYIGCLVRFSFQI